MKSCRLWRGKLRMLCQSDRCVTENGWYLTSLWKQHQFGWLRCKQIHQLLFSCISNKATAQRVFAAPRILGPVVLKPHLLLPPAPTRVTKTTRTEILRMVPLNNMKRTYIVHISWPSTKCVTTACFHSSSRALRVGSTLGQNNLHNDKWIFFPLFLHKNPWCSLYVRSSLK